VTDFNFTVLYRNGNKVTLSDTQSYDDIQRDGIEAIVVKIKNSELFTLWLEAEQRLIYRHRRVKSAGVPDTEQKEPDIYLIGWRQNVNGKDIQSITYICDWPGRGFQIHQAGKFKADHPWFYSPMLRKWEVSKGESYWDLTDKIWKKKA